MDERGGFSEAFERNGVWKWIAAVVIAIMLAGLPGYINLSRTPSRDEIREIRGRQDIVLQRLAAIDVRLATHDVNIEELREFVGELRQLLQR